MKNFMGHVQSCRQTLPGLVLPLALVLGVVLFAAGCGKKESSTPTTTTTTAPTAATSNPGDAAPPATPPATADTTAPPVAAATNQGPPKVDMAAAASAEANMPLLQQLNRAVIRFRMVNHRNPNSVEELASSAGIQLPAAPPGKKYGFNARGFIVLMDSN